MQIDEITLYFGGHSREKDSASAPLKPSKKRQGCTPEVFENQLNFN
jgi:hypothetical protein